MLANATTSKEAQLRACPFRAPVQVHRLNSFRPSATKHVPHVHVHVRSCADLRNMCAAYSSGATKHWCPDLIFMSGSLSFAARCERTDLHLRLGSLASLAATVCPIPRPHLTLTNYILTY